MNDEQSAPPLPIYVVMNYDYANTDVCDVAFTTAAAAEAWIASRIAAANARRTAENAGLWSWQQPRQPYTREESGFTVREVALHGLEVTL